MHPACGGLERRIVAQGRATRPSSPWLDASVLHPWVVRDPLLLLAERGLYLRSSSAEILDELVGSLTRLQSNHGEAEASEGNPFLTAETLGTAFGSAFDVGAAVIELEEAGLLISDHDRLWFSHPLLASTLYGSLTVARRRELHRRLAEVAADPEERARHLARAQRVPDEGAAATVEAAAVLATRRAAPEAAAELYAAACRLTPGGQTEDLARRMLGGAQALNLAGDLEAARSRAMRALASGRAASIRARALLLLGGLATQTDSLESRLEYQERALTEADDDRALRVEILLALFEEIASDPERAAQHADEAIELLRHGADESVRMSPLRLHAVGARSLRRRRPARVAADDPSWTRSQESYALRSLATSGRA